MSNFQMPLIFQAVNRSRLLASKVLARLIDDCTVLADLLKMVGILAWTDSSLVTYNET